MFTLDQIFYGYYAEGALFGQKQIVLYLMMMNCFCDMIDRRKTFSLFSSRDHC